MKRAIFKKLNDILAGRISSARQEIIEARESLDEETKSTVGDKYETGRAMVQIEMDKLQDQLEQAVDMKKKLANVRIETQSKRVEFGSFVITNQGKYFFSIGVGSIMIENEKIFCISLASPIGQALVDKLTGDKVEFQGKTIEILEIS